jgi:hypothetical protein
VVSDAVPNSSNERRALLSHQLHMLVAQGRRIESQSDHHAVLVHGRGLLERREAVSVDLVGNCLVERFGVETERILVAAAGVAVVVIILVIGLVTQ